MLIKARAFFVRNKDKISIWVNIILLLTGIVGFILLYKREIIKSMVDISYVDDAKIYTQTTEKSEPVFIDISGQIMAPGVYEVHRGDILDNVIKRAGGFTKIVNVPYLQKCLNLAKKLVSEQKIYIPASNEDLSCGTRAPEARNIKLTDKISINTATRSDLESIPGIGASTAKKIIDARPFASVDGLKNVAGIGDKTFMRLKSFIVL